LLLLARRPAHAAPVLALVVAIQLVPLAAPLLLSTDPLLYDEWGRMSNPFVGTPGGPPVETYGPLWQLISEPFTRVGSGTYSGTFGFRVLAAVCILVIVGLVWRLTTRKVLAAAIVGWNPFIALHYAGGGHNDALMMCFVLGALLLTSTGAPQLGGASWAISVALKWSSAWFFILWAIERRRKEKPIGLAGALLCGGVIVAVACGIWGTTWLHALSSLSHQEKLDHPSVGTFGWLEDTGLSRHPALLIVGLLQVSALAIFAWAAWQRRLRLGLAAGFLVILAPRLDPWYALWPLALAAADEDDRWGRVFAVAVTGFLFTDVIWHVIEA
jgi:alpha-1,6-mannosyltransferase